MIKIYNTMSAKLEEFKPVEDGKVSMYVCGPTVCNYIHIGNARPIIFLIQLEDILSIKVMM